MNKFWQCQELIHNYRSELHGTGTPGAEVSLIGNFATCINKVYARSRLRGFACACRISASTSIACVSGPVAWNNPPACLFVP